MNRIVFIRLCSMVFLLMFCMQADVFAQDNAKNTSTEVLLESEKAELNTSTKASPVGFSGKVVSKNQVDTKPTKITKELFTGEKTFVENLRLTNPASYRSYLNARENHKNLVNQYKNDEAMKAKLLKRLEDMKISYGFN